MKTVTFIKKSLYGAKGETREVTDRAAVMYEKMGIIDKEIPAPIEVAPVEEFEPEVKEEIEVEDTKETPAPDTKKAKGRPAKTIKAPKL